MTRVGSLVVLDDKQIGYICAIDIATPGSYRHHCKQIWAGKFFYNEPFHIKPIRMNYFTFQ